MNRLALPDLDLAYRREGSGPPLLLLHGWPEWSATWARNIPALAREYDVIAPDLRNFGDSVGAEARDVEHYVADIEALVDALKLERFGVVSHDVGAYLAQDYARRHPGRLAGLFFFNCPHFGIGRRWVEGGQAKETWYQFFHQLPLSVELVGASPAATRAYFAYFLSHWSHRDDAFADALDDWCAMFGRPGRIAGGFRWYACAHERRVAAMRQHGGAIPAPTPIATPAYSLWGAHDPVLRVDWRETLREAFRDVEIEIAPDAGHFVHRECPDLANDRIRAFFARRFA